MFAFTTQHKVIEFPERTSDCLEPKRSKHFPTKKNIVIPVTRERDKRLTWPKRIWRASMANRCAVL